MDLIWPALKKEVSKVEEEKKGEKGAMCMLGLLVIKRITNICSVVYRNKQGNKQNHHHHHTTFTTKTQ